MNQRRVMLVPKRKATEDGIALQLIDRPAGQARICRVTSVRDALSRPMTFKVPSDRASWGRQKTEGVLYITLQTLHKNSQILPKNLRGT